MHVAPLEERIHCAKQEENVSHICGFRERLEQDKVSSITAKIQVRQTQTQNRGMYGQSQRRPLRTRKVKLSGPGVKWAAGASQGGGLESQKDTPRLP